METILDGNKISIVTETEKAYDNTLLLIAKNEKVTNWLKNILNFVKNYCVSSETVLHYLYLKLDSHGHAAP